MDQKCTKIGPKMDKKRHQFDQKYLNSKWAQNGLKIGLKCTQNELKMDLKMNSKWTQNEPKMNSCELKMDPKMDPKMNSKINSK